MEEKKNLNISGEDKSHATIYGNNQHPELYVHHNKFNYFYVSIFSAVLLLLIIFAILIGNSLINPSYKLRVTRDVSANNRQISAAPALVNITNNGFTPSSIYISNGQAISWTNQDQVAHTLTGDNSNLNTLNSKSITLNNSSQFITPGSTYSYVFNKPGNYSFVEDNNSSWLLKVNVN